MRLPRLVEMGYGLDLKSMQSVGYRHAGLVLQGRMSLDNAVQLDEEGYATIGQTAAYLVW